MYTFIFADGRQSRNPSSKASPTKSRFASPDSYWATKSKAAGAFQIYVSPFLLSIGFFLRQCGALVTPGAQSDKCKPWNVFRSALWYVHYCITGNREPSLRLDAVWKNVEVKQYRRSPGISEEQRSSGICNSRG